MAFGPDGGRLATAFSDNARVWEAKVLTPEQKRARFLVGIVRSIWEEVSDRDELQKRIREDRFLNDDERQQCLSFADRYPEKK